MEISDAKNGNMVFSRKEDSVTVQNYLTSAVAPAIITGRLYTIVCCCDRLGQRSDRVAKSIKIVSVCNFARNG